VGNNLDKTAKRGKRPELDTQKPTQWGRQKRISLDRRKMTEKKKRIAHRTSGRHGILENGAGNGREEKWKI